MSMEPALTLREVFAGLAGHDGAGNLGAGALPGHEGLPEELVIRAIGSYADTAPAEVAEHLSAFVAAPTDAGEGLGLLSAVPVEIPEGEVSLGGADEPSDDLDDLGHLDGLGNADDLDALDHAPVVAAGPEHIGPDDGQDADFGHRHPAIEGHDAGPESASDPDDDGHVPVEDLSGDVVVDDEAGAADEPAAEHHDDGHDDAHDDGHHDPGLDHFEV